MNCRIRTEKNGIVVHTYVGFNNYICKVYKSDKTKITVTVVDSWTQAVDKHTEFCNHYLMPAKEEIK